MKTFKETITESEPKTSKLHNKAVHVKNNVVFKIGPGVKHVKPGDRVTSSDMDDLQQAGHQVKEL